MILVDANALLVDQFCITVNANALIIIISENMSPGGGGSSYR